MIKVVIGTMKSAKTSTLINEVEKSVDKNIKIFYPSCCNKVDGYVYSRKDNKKIKGIKIFNLSDLYNNINNTDAIFIDETQFIVSSSNIDDFMAFLEYCDKMKIDVYLFGLQLDYLNNSFDVIQRVLPYADNIITLTANCEVCGNTNAVRCVRFNGNELDCDPNSSLILLESENIVYKSVCKECYRRLTSLPAIK